LNLESTVSIYNVIYW